MTLKGQLRRLLSPAQQPAALIGQGMYHYVREADGQATRFHLRVDNDGSGVLLTNATMAARLSPSGVVIAARLLAGDGPAAITRHVERSFRGASPPEVRRDIERIERLIADLAAPGDNYPILNLDDPALVGSAGPPAMPLSADLLLGSPERMVPLLDRLWELGIPHVTLQLIERPEPQALVRAVERAEDLGMIAGVRGAGEFFEQPSLVHDLAMAGVDHVNLLYLAADAATHDSLLGPGSHALAQRLLDGVRAEDVCAVAEVALVRQTAAVLDATIEDLRKRGLRTTGCFALAAADMAAGQDDSAQDGPLTADAVVQAAVVMEEAATAHDVRALWYPPVQRAPSLSLAEQVRRGPVSSGDHAIRVDPQGNVFPARGPWQAAGNVLRDAWPAIYAHPAYQAYLARVTAPTHCDACPGLAICAADCPRRPEAWVESWTFQTQTGPGAAG